MLQQGRTCCLQLLRQEMHNVWLAGRDARPAAALVGLGFEGEGVRIALPAAVSSKILEGGVGY